MADINQLSQALINADKAGDVDAARILAKEITRLRSEAPAPAEAPQPAKQDAAAEYNAMPWYQQAGQAADDVVRMIANGATFGYADKLAGYMNGDGTEAERAKSDEAHQRAGFAGTTAEIAGSMATGKGLADAGLTAMKLVPKAASGLFGLGARTGAAAVDGAAYGALNATGHDTDVGEGAKMGAIFGTGGNLFGEALSTGIGKVAGAFNKKPAVPSSDQLRDASRQAYQAADDAGVIYSPQAIAGLKDRITRELADFGYDPALQPGAAVVLRRLDDMAGQNATLTGMDTLRKVANNGINPTNPANNAAIAKIVGAIDDAVSNPAAGDVLGGDATAAAQAIQKARQLWGQARKAEGVDQAVERATLRAGSTGSGGNVDNATRQELRRIFEKSRGLTDDEKAAFETAIKGTPAQNAARLIGKLSPGGNGLMAALGLGSTIAAGPVGAVPSAVGLIAKTLADRQTPANVEQLSRIIRAGGQRSATEAAPNAVQRLTQSSRDDIVRLLMMSGITGAAGGN